MDGEACSAGYDILSCLVWRLWDRNMERRSFIHSLLYTFIDSRGIFFVVLRVAWSVDLSNQSLTFGYSTLLLVLTDPQVAAWGA